MSFREGGFRVQKERVTLDLTPLIDCIFQLLIFFLLTASFITTPNLSVELPKASAKASTSSAKDLMVVVTREGKIQFEKKNISAEELLGKLKAIHKARPETRILIHGDKKSYHGTIVQVMDIAKSIGFKRLGITIQKR